MQIKKQFYIKKIILFLVLFSNSSHNILADPRDGEFFFAFGITFCGVISAIYSSVLWDKVKNLVGIKNQFKKLIEDRGGSIREATHSEHYFNQDIIRKNWRLILPEYSTYEDLYIISTNWNKYLEIAEQEFDLKLSTNRLIGISVLSFICGACFFCDQLLNPPYRYRY